MRGNAAWRAPTILIATATAGAVLADFLPDAAAVAVRALVGAMAVTAIGYGARRHRARPEIAWWVVAAGIAVWVVGDTLWDTFDITLSNPDSNWYVLPNCLYLVMYPAVVWAIVKMVAEKGEHGGAERVVDSFIPAVILLLLVRVFIVEGAGTGGDRLDALFNAAFPLCDALLLAGVTWLLFTPGMRNWAAWLLASGTALLLVTDVGWDMQERIAPDTWSWLLNPLYPVAYATIAAATLHPSVVGMTRRQPAARGRGEHTARLALLCSALGLTPVLAFTASRHDLLLVVLTALLVVAIGVRFVTLVRALQLAEHDAATSARRFSSLIASVPVGIMENDSSARVVFSNQAIDELLGHSAVGMSDQELIDQFVDPRDREGVERAVRTLVGGRSAAAQLRMRAADGTERWFAWYGAPVKDTDGQYTGAFSSMIEITSLKDAERTLAKQATHDPLTGLPNRRLLYDRLSTALSRLTRQPGMVVVLFLDLDGFKSVNDMCGHDAGDELLQVVSVRLRHCVRAGDAVARFGGDEFVVVLEQVRDRADAAFIAGKIVHAVAGPVTLRRAQRRVQVGASVGIAVGTSPSDDPDALLRDADAAMFEAKRAGRGTYRFFDQRACLAVEDIRPGEVRGHT
jgi:diguanylate cyclase (GGDEF)-like protein/PAS domain S-box-containing protein